MATVNGSPSFFVSPPMDRIDANLLLSCNPKDVRSVLARCISLVYVYRSVIEWLVRR